MENKNKVKYVSVTLVLKRPVALSTGRSSSSPRPQSSPRPRSPGGWPTTWPRIASYPRDGKKNGRLDGGGLPTFSTPLPVRSHGSFRPGTLSLQAEWEGPLAVPPILLHARLLGGPRVNPLLPRLRRLLGQRQAVSNIVKDPHFATFRSLVKDPHFTSARRWTSSSSSGRSAPARTIVYQKDHTFWRDPTKRAMCSIEELDSKTQE